MKRILISVVLAFVVLLCTSCSADEISEADALKTEGYIDVGTEQLTPEYIMEIDGTKVPFSEFRYYYLNTKYELDQGDESVWEDYPEYVDILKNDVIDILTEVYSLRNLCKNAGVTVTADEVKAALKENKSGISNSDYEEGLKDSFLTEPLYMRILEGYECYTKLFDHYFKDNGTLVMTDEEVIEYAEENYYHAKHILIYPNTTMSDDDYEAYLDEAEDAARNGDFDEAVSKYNKDADMPSYGYYFTKGEMPEEFEAACKKLDIGEVSKLVKSSHGYHIIKRYDIDESNLDELRDIIYNKKYSDMIQNKIDNAEIVYYDDFESITPLTLK